MTQGLTTSELVTIYSRAILLSQAMIDLHETSTVATLYPPEMARVLAESSDRGWCNVIPIAAVPISTCGHRAGVTMRANTIRWSVSSTLTRSKGTGVCHDSGLAIPKQWTSQQ
jgi:hypothetical protein